VPLDYAEPNLGTTVIAYIRQEAVNGTGQDVLYNPGGPGYSGVATVITGGGNQIIEALGGKYNLVTFDPRGVNNSAAGTPLTCFLGDPVRRESDSSISLSASLNEHYYDAVAKGQWCTKMNINTTAKYAGTAAVVQDMVHFTELQATLNGEKDSKTSKIWYFGVSYGTVIGQTLAAMYPDRVGRIILDGNVNADEFYTKGLTASSLEDSEKAFDIFFRNCAGAGPEKCAFARNSTTFQEVRHRFNALLDQLEKTPLINNYSQPGIVTRGDVQNWAQLAMYSPSTWSVFATVIASLESGNATLFNIAMLASSGEPGPFNYTEKAIQESLLFVTNIDSAGRYSIKYIDDYLTIAHKILENAVYGGRSYATTNLLINAGLAIMPPKSQTFSGKFASFPSYTIPSKCTSMPLSKLLTYLFRL
jgi:pimeloyl-ACP methyl ester carboxylesterase